MIEDCKLWSEKRLVFISQRAESKIHSYVLGLKTCYDSVIVHSEWNKLYLYWMPQIFKFIYKTNYWNLFEIFFYLHLELNCVNFAPGRRAQSLFLCKKHDDSTLRWKNHHAHWVDFFSERSILVSPCKLRFLWGLYTTDPFSVDSFSNTGVLVVIDCLHISLSVLFSKPQIRGCSGTPSDIYSPAMYNNG